MENKRTRQGQNHTSRKRQRVDTEDSVSAQPPLKATSTSLAALPWTAVPLPDRFDDAEGFFDLEEIEDVEVVRDAKLGKLEYRVGKMPFEWLHFRPWLTCAA